MLRLEVTDPSRLEQVSGEVHDWFYDLDDVVYDPWRAELVIPFRRWSYEEARPAGPRRGLRRLVPRLLPAWEAPWHRWVLRVGHAHRHAIVDEAGIGGADLCDVTYDAARGVVVVEGTVPVTIEVTVSRLLVSVEETDEVLGLARYRTAGDASLAVSYSGRVHPL